MQMKEILREIEYKQGLLIPALPDESEEEPPQLDVQVVRYEHGRLLIRIDGPIELLKPDLEAELDVATTKALFRLYTSVEKVVKVNVGAHMAYVNIDDVEIVQRRKQERFAVNLQCRFTPVRDENLSRSFEGRPYGFGRVTDLSIGGLQFETRYELPISMLAHLDVRMPTGRLEMLGKIVQAVKDPVGIKS